MLWLVYVSILLVPLMIYPTIQHWISTFSTIVLMILVLSTLTNFHFSVVTNPGFKSTDQGTFCKHCDVYRPIRAHHCKKCKRCVLRMDHHCYWIENCVGYHNQGHFVRLIVSGTLLCCYTTVLLAYFIYDSIHLIDSMGILSLLIVSISITILLPLSTILSMLCYNQLVMLVKNETTIEQLEFKDDRELGLIVDNPFDLGWLENVKQVLGDNVYLWAVPQKMVGDGTLFKVKNTFDL